MSRSVISFLRALLPRCRPAAAAAVSILVAAPSTVRAVGGPCGGCLPIDYRLSYDSPSTGLPNGPGDLLLPGLGLCGPIGSDIDAFSFTDNACCLALPETTLVLYSVDRLTRGLPSSPIREQDDCNGAAGDIFGVIVTAPAGAPIVIAPCFLVCDAPLNGFIPDVPGPESDLDALDVNRDCPPPPPPYVFSEWGSAALTYVTPDSIVPFDGPVLDPGDDIDALNVEGDSDLACIALSLTPGSPTLGDLGYHPGDVLCTTTGGVPLVFLDHLFPLCLCELGDPDCPTDNLDALWFVDPGEKYGYCVVDRWFPVGIHPGMDQITVEENRPVLWVNSLDPQNPVPRCPVIVEVNQQQLFIASGHSAGIAGLPAAPGRSGTTIYPFTVRNALDPSDSTDGVIIVSPTPVTGAPVHPGLLGAMPVATRLVSVQPNPVRLGTSIVFDIPAPAAVVVDVVDIQGRRVKRLTDRGFPAGRHGLEWDGRDDAGQRVASGTYYIRLESAGRSDTRSVTLLR